MAGERRPNAARSAATRAALIAAGRALFTEHGYAGVGTEEIVRRAEVTRGALYHHFDGKASVFQAVFERQQRQLARRLIAATRDEPDVWSQIRRGCDEFLRATLDPAVRRISILEAPSVLGWDEVRAIEAQYTLSLLERSLAQAEAEGVAEPGDRQLRLHLLFGALCEAALHVARSKRPRAALAAATSEVSRLLDGFESKPAR